VYKGVLCAFFPGENLDSLAQNLPNPYQDADTIYLENSIQIPDNQIRNYCISVHFINEPPMFRLIQEFGESG